MPSKSPFLFVFLIMFSTTLCYSMNTAASGYRATTLSGTAGATISNGYSYDAVYNNFRPATFVATNTAASGCDSDEDCESGADGISGSDSFNAGSGATQYAFGGDNAVVAGFQGANAVRFPRLTMPSLINLFP